MTIPAWSQKYQLYIHSAEKDSAFKGLNLGLKYSFNDRRSCSDYVDRLPNYLFEKGFPASSVDSVQYGTSSADLWLYLGPNYKGVLVQTDSLSENVKEYASLPDQSTDLISFKALKISEQKIIEYYNSNGYPFAAVRLDNISSKENYFSGRLTVNKGPLFHIDSLKQYGKLKINKRFLEQYLNIKPGSVYNIQKINLIDKKLLDLQYAKQIQKTDLTMLGTGAIVNVYLDPKRSSRFNALVGLVPSSGINTKTRLTGEVDLDLKNALNSGESILFNWQQLQKQSPRLNIGYAQPFIFNAPFGIESSFDLFKKDSSYVDINGRIGVDYNLSEHQSAKIFFQVARSYLLQGGYDTTQIKNLRRLPQNIDFIGTSIGLQYHFLNTDYHLNPRKGNELHFVASAGLKKFNSNNDILNLKDQNAPDFNFKSLYDSLGKKNYQFRGNLVMSHFFPSGRRSVLKLGVNSGLVQSPHLFRNELFLIGGYKLLRGFNEESIAASQFAIFTTEFRYLTGQNAYLYIFNDIGITGTHYRDIDYDNNFVSAGVGVSFETKAGILNFSYAIGKRNDVAFNLAEASKIHFGFINYF